MHWVSGQQQRKVASPLRVAEYDILCDAGISSEGGLLDLGVELGLIQKAGAFLSYADTRLGQGRENARHFLKLHPEIARYLDGQIRRQTLTGQQFQPETPVFDAPVRAETAEIGTLDTASVRA